MRRGARDFCRRLSFEGWQHLEPTGDTEPLALCPRQGHWQIAVLALGLFRGPVHVIGSGDPRLGRLVAGFERQSGRRLFAFGDSVSEALEADGCVVVVLDRTSDIAEIARGSLAAGWPVVPVSGHQEGRRGWRVVVRAPVDPAGESDVESLERRLELVSRLDS